MPLVLWTVLILLASLAPPPEKLEELAIDGSRVVREVKRDREGNAVNDGKYTRTAPDGTVLAEGKFDEGLARGKWTFRFPNGKTFARGLYQKGQPVKKWILRRPDGQRWAEGVCADGGRSGAWTFFDEDGEEDPLYTGEYRPVAEDWPDGTPRTRGELLEGRPQGTWTRWWPDGTLREHGFFSLGERVGPWRFHHRDGAEEPGSFGDDSERRPWPAIPVPGEIEGVPPAPPVADALPPLVPAPDAALARKVDGLLGDADGKPETAAKKWRSVYPDGVPLLVDRLASAADDPERAARIAGALELAMGGRTFGWGADAEENRAIARRWHSLWSATSEDAILWRLRFSQPAERRGERLDLATLTNRVGAGGAALVPWGEDAHEGSVEAIEAALACLARMQMPDGAWRNDANVGSEDADPDAHAAGLTGLAILAFVRCGHDLERGAYAENVVRGVEYLLGSLDEMDFFGGAREFDFMYSHVIATWSLCELLDRVGLEVNPWLAAPVRRGVATILRAQNPGLGWRYDVPPIGDNDTSLTGWAVRALVSARRCGIEVPDAAFEGALALVDKFSDPANGRVGYDSPGSLSARAKENMDWSREGAIETLTGAGVVILREANRALRKSPDPERLDGHLDLIVRTLPEWGEPKLRDLYGWYWCTQAVGLQGGPAKQAWDKALRRALLDSQSKTGDFAGGWEAETVWAFAGGRAYATLMGCLCLVESLAS